MLSACFSIGAFAIGAGRCSLYQLVVFTLALGGVLVLPKHARAVEQCGYGGPAMEGLGNLHDGSPSGSGNIEFAFGIGLGVGIACGLLAMNPYRWQRGIALALVAAMIAGLAHGAAWFAYRLANGFHDAGHDPGEAWGTTTLVAVILLVLSMGMALSTALLVRGVRWCVSR